MTAFDPTLAAQIAATRVPLTADMAPPGATEARLAQYGERATTFQCSAEREIYRLACDLRGELERSRSTLSDQRVYETRLREQHDLDVAEINRLRRERDALQERLHQVALAKVWTNEDRKKFVFVADITGPLFGIEPKAGESP